MIICLNLVKLFLYEEQYLKISVASNLQFPKFRYFRKIVKESLETKFSLFNKTFNNGSIINVTKISQVEITRFLDLGLKYEF